MTSRPSIAAPVLAVLGILLITLGAYVGGYVWLGEFDRVKIIGSPPKQYAITRSYSHRWAREVFRPAGSVEAWLRSEEVLVLWEGEFEELEEPKALPPFP